MVLEGSRIWSSIAARSYLAPIFVRSGPTASPTSPTLWQVLHWAAGFVVKTMRPRAASPRSARIAGRSTTSPSRLSRSPSGMNRSNRSRTSIDGLARVTATTSRRSDSDAGPWSMKPSSIKAPRVEDASRPDRRRSGRRASGADRRRGAPRARAVLGGRRCTAATPPVRERASPRSSRGSSGPRARRPAPRRPGASGRRRAWRRGSTGPTATGLPAR